MMSDFSGWIDYALECIEWQVANARDLMEHPMLVEYFIQRAAHHSIAVMAMESLDECEVTG